MIIHWPFTKNLGQITFCIYILVSMLRNIFMLNSSVTEVFKNWSGTEALKNLSVTEVFKKVSGSGGRLNKKDGLTRYGNSHVKDKTS